MTTQTLSQPPAVPVNTLEAQVSVRDRLLKVLAEAPRLHDEDAAFMNRVVQEAREASIADGLSA